MRTITLELLRHGPAHNQLLSPLTPYLALCENHGAVTLHVPFEHNQFLHRLDALGYKLKYESRLFQLRDTAAVLGELLGAIPGFIAETSKATQENGSGDANEDHSAVTHLRLIISASELALLPFELALSPAGSPGTGQPLLLQTQMPLCLTREVRRTPDVTLSWPDRPKILFAAAAPPQVGEIPLQSHLLALRTVIEPWIGFYPEDDVKLRNMRIGDHLKILPEASIEEIALHCASGDYSHIHILAHGVKVRRGYDERYCLALHHSRDREKADYVDGPRLATALRAAQRCGNHALARPAVVTLASCDASNVGSVAGAGSSIAHALHDAGIPLIVAGQFPLSFGGSVRLVEVLYKGLLWGEDPRELVHQLRRDLFAEFPDTHDWASLTVYASLPAGFEDTLSKIRVDRAVQSINAAMSHADVVTGSRSKLIDVTLKKKSEKEAEEDANNKITAAKKKLNSLLLLLPNEKARIHGLLASAEKRHGELVFSKEIGEAAKPHGRSPKAAAHSEDAPPPHAASLRMLERAHQHYLQSFMLDRSHGWAMVQYLSLDLVLRNAERDKKNSSIQLESPENLKEIWGMARQLALYDLDGSSKDSAIWAHGNLLELYLLAPLPELRAVGTVKARRLAFEHTDRLVEVARADAFEVYSTRRQMRRYPEWFGKLIGNTAGSNDSSELPLSKAWTEVVTLAKELFQRLPSAGEEKW